MNLKYLIFALKNPLFSLREDPFSDRESSIEIHRGQGNTNILELTEPGGLSQRDLDGHWMADFYIEFTHDRYGNNDDVIKKMDVDTAYLWHVSKPKPFDGLHVW